MIETSTIDDVLVLRLAHGKASALDLELVETLREDLQQAAADRVGAVVLTGTAHIFCAGVDLFRVADGGPDYVRQYIPAFRALMFALFAFERPLVAAINGHAIAGGAVLAAAADHRLMAEGDGRFGYTELRVGVPFPPAALEIIRFATPAQVLPGLLYGGDTLLPAAALACGVVDGLAAPGEFMGHALERARRLARLAPAAFADTKRQLRAPALSRMKTAESEFASGILAAWTAPETHAAIRAYLAATVRRA